MKQDLEQDLLILQRINMRKALEKDFQDWFACWLARIWPAWLFPAVLYYRLKRYSES